MGRGEGTGSGRREATAGGMREGTGGGNMVGTGKGQHVRNQTRKRGSHGGWGWTQQWCLGNHSFSKLRE
jgi:hypothetical protein